MPVLLFGSESWYLTDAVLEELEKFQCWIGKKILRLSRSHSNTAVRIGLDWPSMRARVLIRKLNYLRKLVGEGEERLSSQIFLAFGSRDVSQLTIIEQCRYLETVYETNFTGEVLTSADVWRNIHKKILTVDKHLRADSASTHQSLKHLSAIHSEVSWLRIWDVALDYGTRGSKSALSLFRTLSHPLFGCPRCETPITDTTYIEHLIHHHKELKLTPIEEITESLISASPDLLKTGYSLSTISPTYDTCENAVICHVMFLYV